MIERNVHLAFSITSSYASFLWSHTLNDSVITLILIWKWFHFLSFDERGIVFLLQSMRERKEKVSRGKSVKEKSLKCLSFSSLPFKWEGKVESREKGCECNGVSLPFNLFGITKKGDWEEEQIKRYKMGRQVTLLFFGNHVFFLEGRTSWTVWREHHTNFDFLFDQRGKGVSRLMRTVNCSIFHDERR